MESGNKKQNSNIKDANFDQETGAQDMEFSNDPDIQLKSPDKRTQKKKLQLTDDHQSDVKSEGERDFIEQFP